MKRSALIFLAAIFLPSLLLGWLALRTAGEQRVLIERQAADLHQAETDALAAAIRDGVLAAQRNFAEAVRNLVAQRSPAALAENYGSLLAGTWTGGGVPFAINPQGGIAYPRPVQSADRNGETDFLAANSAFLSNRAQAEIYQAQATIAPEAAKKSAAKPRAAELSKEEAIRQKSQAPSRNVAPQKDAQYADAAALESKVAPELSDFQTAVGTAAQGALARFVQDDLQVLFWTRPDPGSNWLFGVKLGPEELNRLVRTGLPDDPGSEVLLAVLNDRAKPAARSPRDFEADWKRPFVATEIGEVLPHWEVALYLTNPGKLTESARLVSLTLILLIALALAAILAGGSLVALDTRRQLALAQKKTDFVSNVSHELKTPLTSIRMFAELLADDRVRDPDKRTRFLRIIAGESERLARLVNNVLDFARMEKKRKTYDLRAADLLPVIERVWESESLRLREAGFAADWQADPGPYPAMADPDAIAQVLVNLLSNAEKYSPERKEISLRATANGRLRVEVLDRGAGITRAHQEKIFDAFFRTDDSLASGVTGSGLGLTLARRIARDHGGDVTCRPREGGGSIFTLELPLTNAPHTEPKHDPFPASPPRPPCPPR